VIVLDASVLIAAMNPTDAHGRAATRIIRAFSQRGALAVHAVNLAEALVGAIQAGQEERARRAVHLLGLHVCTDDLDAPWRWATLRATTALRMPDCCALDTAQREGAPLATFDERLAALARGAGIEVVAL
jgi:predicted nucleic acid-binding protein